VGRHVASNLQNKKIFHFLFDAILDLYDPPPLTITKIPRNTDLKPVMKSLKLGNANLFR
jgi:hypothetical protein